MNKLDSLLKRLADQYETLKLIETIQKKYTYFGLFRVKEAFTAQAFSIKFEASIRPVNWKKLKGHKFIVHVLENKKFVDGELVGEVAA